MRTPLSWLRDFAPFPDDVAHLRATLDDLGLVVEDAIDVGQGLDDVVVARVLDVSAIEGADRIRRVLVDAGDGEALQIVCGAFNFTVGDLVPLAPVGATLPGDVRIKRAKMRGVESNGMLCSGSELGLSEDGAGLLVLTDVAGVAPGQPVAAALGVEPDTVFDITVEGNRPDAWSVSGVARDLAARLGLPFSRPEPPDPDGAGAPAVGDLASLVVEDTDLCPRMTVRVLTGVQVGPSPAWLARRLTLAGMRPINSVVDASNYVMLELGQPTHPYDLDRLAGRGLRVRRAREGETVETLDGVVRTLGVPGRGLGDTGPECLIADAEGAPVGIAGIMGGVSSEITDATTTVLLETAYFDLMAVARTSKRLGLRTEASARFERGCDPSGLARAAARFCQLVTGAVPTAVVARGLLDEGGEVPRPFTVPVALSRVNERLGLNLAADDVGRLIEPIGFTVADDGGGTLSVTVPTDRPDVRPAPFGVDDVIEEVARTFGYARLPRRTPLWPQPGRLEARQRDRRLVHQVCAGLGLTEGWTATFVDDGDNAVLGLPGPAVHLTNPLVAEEDTLRRSMLPGLVRAVARNLDRRQGLIRLFEVGRVFTHPDAGGGRPAARAGAGGAAAALAPGERELLCAVWAGPDDDARQAVAGWGVLTSALLLEGVRVVDPGRPGAPAGGPPVLAGLHPTRRALLVGPGEVVLGAVGEVDPEVARAFGVEGRRLGWLEVDLDRLLDPAVVPRRDPLARDVSRFPSSDIDLALVVPDTVAADEVAAVLRRAGGDLLESLDLFDVYRGPGVAEGSRSLAFRLRFCSMERTLTDAEVGELRTAAVAAAAEAVGAELR